MQQGNAVGAARVVVALGVLAGAIASGPSAAAWTPNVVPAAEEETLLLQDPAVSAKHVVFEYAGDLWVAGIGGGDARRLTSNPGSEVSPRISPDGQWVAFTGEYDGNPDVYVIPIEGGAPTRLTWHPGADVVRDWHPDGQRILFASGRTSDEPGNHLFLVSKDGGMPTELPIPSAVHAAYKKDGSRLVYTPYRDPFRSWKRYRGGLTPEVWIYDPETFDVEVVPKPRCSDTFPCFAGDDVYFASDRDEHMNVWRYTPGTKEPVQVTHFTDYDVRNMSAGAGLVVFEQAGAIHVLDPKSGQIRRLRIQVRADGLAARPRWQEVRGFVRNAAIAPNGKRAVFEARGEIVTVPAENGDPRNLSSSPGAHDRSPTWSPDGQQVAWFSDASGEYQLVVRDQNGQGEEKSYDLGGGGFYSNPAFSPDGKHLLFTDKFNRIAFLTFETGKVTDVAVVQGSLGEVRPTAIWSPDSQWIALEMRNLRTMYDSVTLYSLATGESTTLTDAFGNTGSPAFSASGKYLFFAASVDSGPNLFGLDMSTSASRNPSSNLYVAVLAKDTPNPLAPKSDEAVADEKAKGDGEKAAGKGEKGEGAADGAEAKVAEADAKPSIDLDGLDQRILALPVPGSNFANLACAGETLLFLDVGDGGFGGGTLKSFSFDDREVKTVSEGIGGFLVSGDQKSLLLSSRGGFAITSADGKNRKGLGIDSVKVYVDPAQEWPQTLREAWRIERDYFYDPQMHGVDWNAMWDRWSAMLPYVAHRADLNVLLSEMIGELCCGHNYVGGGETPDRPDGVSVGLLGADFAVEQGRYRITRIYRGQNWNPRSSAPLTGPGVDVREGDFLVSVDGRPIDGKENLYQAFENTAGRQVELTVSAKADGSEPRTSKIVPIGNDGQLRRMAWIEDNRRRVDELSGGKLGYIYMPNTGGPGMAAFDRDFYSQLNKQGLVIDERYNGGGQVANYVIDVLSRQVMCYWTNREQWTSTSPFGTMTGPKVMLINEAAGSGGDWMPWMFQRRGVGPLVGRRTWGGLVGISGYPPLMDGGSVTAASFGVRDPDGNWAVENEGVWPDHEVVQWPKAVIAGGDPQLEKAVEVALEMLKTAPPKKLPGYLVPAKR